MKVEMNTRYFARSSGSEANGFNGTLTHVARALPKRRSKGHKGGLNITTLTSFRPLVSKLLLGGVWTSLTARCQSRQRALGHAVLAERPILGN